MCVKTNTPHKKTENPTSFLLVFPHVSSFIASLPLSLFFHIFFCFVLLSSIRQPLINLTELFHVCFPFSL
uniref:Uncharacterized protein n=1 Tax=Anguilla anguilla TaxID=7936 RepID=A0A0E9VUE3_ANGAN